MSLEELFILLRRLPPNQYLRIGMEPCGGIREDKIIMLVASLWEDPPEGGWTDSWMDECHRHEPRIRWAVNGNSDTELAMWTMDALRRHLGRSLP